MAGPRRTEWCWASGWGRRVEPLPETIADQPAQAHEPVAGAIEAGGTGGRPFWPEQLGPSQGRGWPGTSDPKGRGAGVESPTGVVMAPVAISQRKCAVPADP